MRLAHSYYISRPIIVHEGESDGRRSELLPVGSPRCQVTVLRRPVKNGITVRSGGHRSTEKSEMCEKDGVDEGPGREGSLLLHH